MLSRDYTNSNYIVIVYYQCWWYADQWCKLDLWNPGTIPTEIIFGWLFRILLDGLQCDPDRFSVQKLYKMTIYLKYVLHNKDWILRMKINYIDKYSLPYNACNRIFHDNNSFNWLWWHRPICFEKNECVWMTMLQRQYLQYGTMHRIQLMFMFSYTFMNFLSRYERNAW